MTAVAADAPVALHAPDDGPMRSRRCVFCPLRLPVHAKDACVGCYVRFFVKRNRTAKRPPALRRYPEGTPLYICATESQSRKLRGMVNTYSPRSTCPPSCGLFDACYAKGGFVGNHWRRLNEGTRGEPWAEHLEMIRYAGARRIRLNVAGDLPGAGEAVDFERLLELASAATHGGRQAWTYTHKPPTRENVAALQRATAETGLVVNLSADNLAEADELAATGFPVVVVLPEDAPKVSRTPAGRRVIVCPAQLDKSARLVCTNCGGAGERSVALCARDSSDRDFIVGFRAHGNNRLGASFVATGGKLPMATTAPSPFTPATTATPAPAVGSLTAQVVAATKAGAAAQEIAARLGTRPANVYALQSAARKRGYLPYAWTCAICKDPIESERQPPEDFVCKYCRPKTCPVGAFGSGKACGKPRADGSPFCADHRGMVADATAPAAALPPRPASVPLHVATGEAPPPPSTNTGQSPASEHRPAPVQRPAGEAGGRPTSTPPLEMPMREQRAAREAAKLAHLREIGVLKTSPASGSAVVVLDGSDAPAVDRGPRRTCPTEPAAPAAKGEIRFRRPPETGTALDAAARGLVPAPHPSRGKQAARYLARVEREDADEERDRGPDPLYLASGAVRRASEDLHFVMTTGLEDAPPFKLDVIAAGAQEVEILARAVREATAARAAAERTFGGGR